MKIKIILIAIFVALGMCACSNSEQEGTVQLTNCLQTGFTSERVCAISHFQAFGSEIYINRMVRISGYVADVNVGGDRNRLLFFSREQAEMQNAQGGIGIGEFSPLVKPSRISTYKNIVQSREVRPVELVGRLTRNTSSGLAQPALTLTDLVGAREIVTAAEMASVVGN